MKLENFIFILWLILIIGFYIFFTQVVVYDRLQKAPEGYYVGMKGDISGNEPPLSGYCTEHDCKIGK